MERNIFDGKRPVAILNFLASFKRALDGEFIPEAAALQITPHFLDGHPHDVFQAMIDDANAGFGGFNTWPHAVQFLLETYATDANIEDAIDELEEMRITQKESIEEFRIRLTSAARALAGAYPQDALINRFIRNLPRHVRDIVRLEAPKYKGPAALTKIANIASAYYKSHSNLRTESTKSRELRFKALSVEDLNAGHDHRRSRVADLGPPEAKPTKASPEVVAVAETPRSPYPPSNTDYTPTVEYSVRDLNDGAPPDPYFDAVHAVADTRPRFPPRPMPTPAQRTRESQLIPLVCFICYLIGHRSSECRHRNRVSNDADFQRWQLANYQQLQQWQQMWLQSINRVPVLAIPKPTPGPRPSNIPTAVLLRSEAQSSVDPTTRSTEPKN